MKKTIIIAFLVILLIGCAQVKETKQTEDITTKETVAEQKTEVKEEVKTETKPAATVTKTEIKETAKEPEVTQPITSETQISLNAGEAKTVTLGENTYNIKLLSVSNRAQFSVNGEITKDLMTSGVHVLRDGTELSVIELGYNTAFIKLKLAPEKELIPTSAVPTSDGPVSLMKGVFRTVEKKTAGYAEIMKTLEGDIILTFTSFQTEPGPGLYVYLVDQTIADGYEVAKLFSREGNQQYSLPKDIDLRNYKKIVIYSKSEQKIYGEATAP